MNLPDNMAAARWRASGSALARWSLTLEPLEATRLDGLMALLQVILEEGHDQGVLRLAHPEVADVDVVARYVEALRAHLTAGREAMVRGEARGVDLWGWGEPDVGWHTTSKVALSEGEAPSWAGAPVGLSLSSPPLMPQWPVEIALELHADVWFPRLPRLRMMGGHHRPANPFSHDAVDNLALASQHTPRLNAFLDNVAQSVRIFGGRWALDDARGGAWYRPMCHERGIALGQA